MLHGEAVVGVVRLAAGGEVEGGQGQGRQGQGGAGHPGGTTGYSWSLELVESFSLAITRRNTWICIDLFFQLSFITKRSQIQMPPTFIL